MHLQGEIHHWNAVAADQIRSHILKHDPYETVTQAAGYFRRHLCAFNTSMGKKWAPLGLGESLRSMENINSSNTMHSELFIFSTQKKTSKTWWELRCN